MGVKLWSLTIANMLVLVLTLLATVAASPLPSQVRRADPVSLVETPELSESEDLAVEASSVQASHSRVPSGAIAAILAAANAQPKAIDRSPGYGKRSADNKEESETKLGLVQDVPLDAVKVVIHSSHGNIAQHYDGDTAYQNAVLGSRFGRGKRETDNFIPFSEYDSRRVNTLKLEQNDFLALPARLQSQSQEKKKRHFSES